MKTYLVEWTDGGISIFNADADESLDLIIDSYGDARCCKVFKLPRRFYLAAEVRKGDRPSKKTTRRIDDAEGVHIEAYMYWDGGRQGETGTMDMKRVKVLT